MKVQTYYNHIRFYIPHHFIYYPVLIFFLICSIYFACTTNDTLIWSFISVGFIFLFFLAFMLRQHYALILQNRIIRLEVRYRYFTLTGKRFEEFEYKLTDDQIFALRFAPDAEFLSLVQDALKNNLPGDSIKKAIVHWKADYDRV
ncbi:hypothetical protein EYY60_08545 [Flavobacterium zhairuonense]|uniref:DUF6526 family protein n=1 Tax=Flavobacterium zhairuonense TaxID=2493631 RepID=UPI00104BE2D7|nr:DUF6526 family protein [Flavobacterium zhairuonense]KAF2511472.1 hypothetical protein EYY60_08545 [Flavobacterium zhairuonense]